MTRLLALGLLLALPGCGGTPTLVASDFRGAPPARYAGLTADAGRGIGNQPTWRQPVRTGTRLAVSVVLRNTGKDAVTITGQGKGDPDRDGVWRPDAVEGAPIRLAPGASRRVTFLGHAECDADHVGAMYSFGRTDVAHGDDTDDVDLNGRLQLSCSG